MAALVDCDEPGVLNDASTPPSSSVRQAKRTAHLRRLSLAGPAALGSLGGSVIAPLRDSPTLFMPDRASPSPVLGPAASPSPSPLYNPRARSHARRQSSISYRCDPSLVSPHLSQRSPGGIGYGPVSPAARARTPTESVSDENSSPVPPSPTLGVSGTRPNGVSAGGNGPATLLEQHGDLLSFIAKKERTCLDLREELKRNEDELKALKAQWEVIVSRELRSPPTPATPANPTFISPAGTPISPSLGRRHGVRHSIGGPLPDVGDPMSAAGLAISPVGGPGVATGEALPDLGTAKRYLGGLMKSGMAGMSGILEGLAAPPTDLPDLGQIREEDEDEQMDEPASFDFSTTTRESSRSSLASSAAKPSEDGHAPPLEPSAGSPSGSEDTLTTSDDHASAPYPFFSEPAPAPAPPRTMPSSKTDKHARRRSVFDTFSSVGGSLSGSLGRKLAEVTGSETFKSSKRATLSLVDTFERTLTDAIAIDDGPPVQAASPQPDPSARPRGRHSSTAPLDADWSSLLDGSPSPPPVPDKAPSALRRSPLLDELDVSAALHTAPLKPDGPPPRATRIPPRHAKRLSMPAFNHVRPTTPSAAAQALAAVPESNSGEFGDGDWAAW